MQSRHKFVGISAIVFLLLVLTVLQLQAQTPTTTPTSVPVTNTVTPIAIPATANPVSTTLLSVRQAVVKRSIDGDSVEVVFTDDGQIAVVHLANVNAPESITEAECFGRESAEYAAQAYQDNPLVSIELAGEVQDGEVLGYVKLADGTLLNRLVVLFGYARYDDQVKRVYTTEIREAEEQSKQGKTGLWRTCGETEKPPKPCYLFNDRETDSASKRAVFAEFPDVTEVSVSFIHAYYDQVQHEIVVTWDLRLDGNYGWRMDEYYRLSDCLRDRSNVYEDD